MPGSQQVRGPRAGVDERLDRSGPVGGRDAGADSPPGIHGDGECGSVAGGVRIHHHGDLQLVEPLADDGHADEAAAETRHEVDGLRRHLLRRDSEVSLVLTILVVDDNDELSGLEFRDRFRNARKRHLRPPQ